jgi:hypothetical protein
VLGKGELKMTAATATKRKRSSSKNDVEGAALAIAVLNFMRPDFMARSYAIPASGHLDLTRDDGYEQTVDRIIQDYCPQATDSIAISISSEVRRFMDILRSSGELTRALGLQRTAARRRGAK